MMTALDSLELIVRTPNVSVFQRYVRSVRVPTESGHVGLHRRAEPAVLAVDPGIVNVRSEDGRMDADTFIGTAGGLLVVKDNVVTLLTPIAVIGENEQAIATRFDALMAQPSSELEARVMLTKLEGHILNELRQQQRDGAALSLERF